MYSSSSDMVGPDKEFLKRQTTSNWITKFQSQTRSNGIIRWYNKVVQQKGGQFAHSGRLLG